MSTRVSARSFRKVFAFCVAQWMRQGWLAPVITLAVVISTLCDAFIPTFAGHLIDALTQGLAGKTVAIRAVMSIAAAALGVTSMRSFAFWLQSDLASRVMKRLVDEGFFRVQRFSTDWHESGFSGATVRKITRGMWAYDSLSDTVLLGLLPAFVVLVAVTVLMSLHWATMGIVIALGVIVFITISVNLVLRFLAPATVLSNEADSRIGATLADATDCNAVVKSFAGERREDVRLAKVTELWRSRTYRTWSRFTLSGYIQNLMVISLQAIVLGIGIWLWAQGRATPGDIAYVISTYALIQGYLREISNHVRTLQRAVAEMEDLVNFADLPLGIADRDRARPLRRGHGEITFDRVRFRYGGQSQALYENFSLTIRAGERIGLVGQSGSGKSTFVKLIQRLYDVNDGRILIDGQDIASVTQESLRGAIAVVPQDPVLFHRTLAENIGYGRADATHGEIVEAATQAHADEFIATLPLGYDTEVGERGVKLSGGERQRVALARAVLSDAEIMILDEATSSLDSISEKLMQDAVETVIAGRTTIIIAHRLSTVQKADRILVFDAGKIVEQGAHAELLQRPNGYYRRLFESQALGLIGVAAAG